MLVGGCGALFNNPPVDGCKVFVVGGGDVVLLDGLKVRFTYLDNNDNNHWRKVSQIVDSGGWYAKSSDEEFYSAGCGKAKDYVITNSGPLVTFRSDNMVWDFADLSVREIQPPPLPQ